MHETLQEQCFKGNPILQILQRIEFSRNNVKEHPLNAEALLKQLKKEEKDCWVAHPSHAMSTGVIKSDKGLKELFEMHNEIDDLLEKTVILKRFLSDGKLSRGLKRSSLLSNVINIEPACISVTQCLSASMSQCLASEHIMFLMFKKNHNRKDLGVQVDSLQQFSQRKRDVLQKEFGCGKLATRRLEELILNNATFDPSGLNRIGLLTVLSATLRKKILLICILEEKDEKKAWLTSAMSATDCVVAQTKTSFHERKKNSRNNKPSNTLVVFPERKTKKI